MGRGVTELPGLCVWGLIRAEGTLKLRFSSLPRLKGADRIKGTVTPVPGDWA